MKWINHQVVTGVAVYTATSDLLLTAYSMAGALLPDKLEGNPRAGNYWAWRSRHRGWSHWPVLYLALLGISLHFGNGDYGFEGGELATIGKFFAIGALLHIAEDMTCGKVPARASTPLAACSSISSLSPSCFCVTSPRWLRAVEEHVVAAFEKHFVRRA